MVGRDGVTTVPQSRNVKDLAEVSDSNALCPLRVRLFSKQAGLPAAHTLQGLNYQLSREELLDRRVQPRDNCSRLVVVSMKTIVRQVSRRVNSYVARALHKT
jgi:hypothetical protein